MEGRRGRDRPTLHLRTGTYAGVTDLWPVTMSADIHPWPHCLPGVLPSNNTDRRELQKIVQRLQSIGNVYWHDTRLLARYFYFIWRAAWPTFRERKYLYPTSYYKYLTQSRYRGVGRTVHSKVRPVLSTLDFLSIHGCLGLEILGLDSELVFFCHLCWSCTELVFGICDF